MALIDALAGEHRLRRQALREQREVERWLRRAAFAEERGLADLAAAARARSERHARTASVLTDRAVDLREEIESLRRDVQAPRGVGRAPPEAPSLEVRFRDLEIEREVDRIRSRGGENAAPPTPIPPQQ